MNIPNEGKLTNQMWVDFLNSVSDLIPFCTILDAVGIFKGEVEQSKIISITVDERTTGAAVMISNLEKVGDMYKKQFRQESVLISQVQTNNAFI